MKILGTLGAEPYAPRFLPPRRTRPGSVRDGKNRWVFPGYVLFRPGVGFASWADLRSSPGIHRLLMSDGAPATLSNDVIQHIRTRLDEHARRPALLFRTGDPVRIVQGPLSELNGVFQRRMRASDRVAILIQLMGRAVEVEIDPENLRLAG